MRQKGDKWVAKKRDTGLTEAIVIKQTPHSILSRPVAHGRRHSSVMPLFPSESCRAVSEDAERDRYYQRREILTPLPLGVRACFREARGSVEMQGIELP